MSASKILQFPSARERAEREQERLGREFDRLWESGEDCTEMVRGWLARTARAEEEGQ
jgi:hypothetical protein